MFNDSGGKLKMLAKVILWLSVIAAIICVFIFIEIIEGLSMLFIVSVIIISGWLLSMVFYTIGDISDTVRDISEKLDYTEDELDSISDYIIKNSLKKNDSEK